MNRRKIGFLADAHGNPIGLRACIDALRGRGCGEIYFLGDAVGYLPMAEAVLAMLEGEGIACQMGNHEGMLCGLLPLSTERDAVYGLAGLRSQLRPDRLSKIASWPMRRDLEVDGRRLLMVHGSPRDELTEYVFPDSDLSPFAQTGADLIAMGHSHFPFVRTVASTTVVGVGSCGLPRDVGNLASCALYEPASGAVEIIRVPFDVERVLALASAIAPAHDSVARVMRRIGHAREIMEPLDD